MNIRNCDTAHSVTWVRTENQSKTSNIRCIKFYLQQVAPLSVIIRLEAIGFSGIFDSPDFGRDPGSSYSWRSRRYFAVFRQVSNAWFNRFPVCQISRNLNTTRRSVSRWKCSKPEFWKFYSKGSFFKKNFSIIFNVLWLPAAITSQWLQITGNSLPK